MIEKCSTLEATESSELLKSLAMNQIPMPFVVVDKASKITYMNPAACKWARKDLKEAIGVMCFSLFPSPDCTLEGRPVSEAMKYDRTVIKQIRVQRGNEMVQTDFTAAPLKDDKGKVIGGLEFVVDITDRLDAESRAQQLRMEILELSTPVLSLWDSILCIPLIGTLDSKRTQDVMEKALVRLAEDKARVIVIDITGVPVIDTMVANHLIRMSSAVKLMGGDCILTGISPATAKTIVHLGINLSSISTCASLSQGLEKGMKIVNKERGTQ